MKSFKSFLEEKNNPYLNSLQDELGIDLKDLKSDPQVATFYSLGKTIQNIGSYKILEFKRNDKNEITHAVVKQINDPKIKNRKYQIRNNKIIKNNKNQKNKIFLIKIEDLDKLLSQDFQPSQQQSLI